LPQGRTAGSDLGGCTERPMLVSHKGMSREVPQLSFILFWGWFNKNSG